MACACTACGHHTHETYGGSEQSGTLWNNRDIVRFSIAVLLFIAGIVCETGTVLYNIGITIGGSTIAFNLPAILFIGAWLCAGSEVIQTLFKTIGKGSIFDENFLMTFATVGAFILGEWTEGAAVMLFYNLGELLQAAAVRKSRASITNLMDLRPEFARLYRSPTAETSAEHCEALHDGHSHVHEHETGHKHDSCCREHGHSAHTEHMDVHTGGHIHGHDHCGCGHDHSTPCTPDSSDENLVPPETVAIGTLILVKTGEKVPLDGILVHGACSFDTASMTGESVPRFIDEGGTVLAGFINLDGLALIKTTASAENTAAAKMLELVEQAQNRKAKAERLISAFARIYTPIVTIGAVVLAFLPPLLLSVTRGAALEWAHFTPWISRGLVFLVISCPCAFVISVPLGYFGGLGGAAKKGILIKGADFIDALAKADTVVFDKTGTLTAGILTVTHVIPADGAASGQLFELAYIAEYYSGHPIAKAVKNYIRQETGKDQIAAFEQAASGIQQYTEKAGSGVKMRWNGQELAAGSAPFIFDCSATPPHTLEELEGTKVFISYGGSYIGCIICSDTIKPQAAQTVSELRKAGISYLEMLTGDTKKTGEYIASKLQLDRCSSELLPHEKVRRFEELSTERKAVHTQAVCVFVGDGINDAPALARADVGIAMGGIGSDAAIEAADVVLMNDSPLLIPQAIALARFTRKIVKQNIILSFAVKIAFLAGGAFGIIGLWAAVFADVGVALLAVCNSLRARRF